MYWSEAAEASARLVIEDGATGWRVGAQTTRLRDSGIEVVPIVRAWATL